MDSRHSSKPDSRKDLPQGVAYFLPEIIDLANAFYCKNAKHARVVYVPIKHASVFAGVSYICDMAVRFGTTFEVDRK